MGSCLTTSSSAGASSARIHLHEGPPLASLRQVDCLPLPPALLIYMRGLPWPPCARWTASLCLLSPHLHEGPPLAPLRQVDCLPLPPVLLIYMSGVELWCSAPEYMVLWCRALLQCT